MASINFPKSYTCAQCQHSQLVGFNYCRGCGVPTVSKTEISESLQEDIGSITALVLPRTLVFKSTVGGASGKRLRINVGEFRFKGKDREGFEANCKGIYKSQTKKSRNYAGCVDRYSRDHTLQASLTNARKYRVPNDMFSLLGWGD